MIHYSVLSILNKLGCWSGWLNLQYKDSWLYYMLLSLFSQCRFSPYYIIHAPAPRSSFQAGDFSTFTLSATQSWSHNMTEKSPWFPETVSYILHQVQSLQLMKNCRSWQSYSIKFWSLKPMKSNISLCFSKHHDSVTCGHYSQPLSLQLLNVISEPHFISFIEICVSRAAGTACTGERTKLLICSKV